MIHFLAPNLTAPAGSIIGVIEEGLPVLHSPDAERLEPGDPLPEQPGDYILDHTLAQSDSVTRSLGVARLMDLRRAGAAIVMLSHDETLLENCADEIWWLREGELIARGDPASLLPKYRAHVADLLTRSGEGHIPRLSPTMRNGDGRASLESIELLDGNDQPAIVWRSGAPAAVRVTVRYAARVEDPVIGIMIRTRIGLNVYGTNTELEQLKLGPVNEGDSLRVTYRFRCDLCPGEYTVTAASHDPDGLWHDWMEEAVAFSVADSRYTAGVANLRAEVKAEVTSAAAQGQSART
jgi:lipopolysaccharide transport system ATP-binding protein